MAAIGKIRSWGPFLICVVGVALFAFIAGDLWQSCEATGNEKRMQIGEVLGKKVSVQEFQALVDEYQQVIKLTQGRDNLSEAELNNVQDQVWSTYVNNAIMEDEAEKLGLMVTKEELQNVLKEGTNPILLQTPFVNSETGRFDVTNLTKFLAEYKSINNTNPQLAEQYATIYKYWQFTEKMLKQQLLTMKYQGLFIGCLISNPISAKYAFDGENQETTIKLASIPYSSIKDSTITVTDADLKAKLDEKKDMYKHYAESRDIKYVDFQVLPSKADREAIYNNLTEVSNKLKENAEPSEVVRKSHSLYQYVGLPVTKKALPSDVASIVDTLEVGETTGPFETRLDNTLNVVKLISKTSMPDSIEYRQINVMGANADEISQRADSILNALKSGAVFEDVAKVYGQTGEKQWLTSSMYESSNIVSSDNKLYIETITNLPVNEVSKLDVAQASIILQVTERKAFVDKYLVAVVKNTIDFSKETYSAAYNKFSQFVSENQSIDSIISNASKYGFVVSERKNIYNSEHNVVGIHGTREALKWVFDAKEGDVSPLYECGNNDHLLVLAMTKVHPVGYSTVDDVRDVLKAEVLNDKKFDAIAKKLGGIQKLDDASANGGIINEVSQITFAAPVFVSATGTSEPALCGAVAAAEKGKLSSLVKGNGGAYIFEVVNKTERTAEKYDEKTMINQLQGQALNAASRFMNELYINSNVVDNRYLFF